MVRGVEIVCFNGISQVITASARHLPLFVGSSGPFFALKGTKTDVLPLFFVCVCAAFKHFIIGFHRCVHQMLGECNGLCGAFDLLVSESSRKKQTLVKLAFE